MTYQQLINIRKPYILYLLKYFTRTLIDNLSPMNIINTMYYGEFSFGLHTVCIIMISYDVYEI